MTAMFILQPRWIGMAVAIAAVISGPTAFGASTRSADSCLVEVLTSEMLPVAPPFYHTVRTRLRVTATDHQPFETTVVRTIPWQAPPPRQGQRVWEPCEQVPAHYEFHLF